MAERTESSIEIDAPPALVLAVIADFGSYPEWAGAVKEAQVLRKGAGGRAARVGFVLDAGAIKDSYSLDYTWTVAKDGSGTIAWTIVEQGTLLKALDGSYTLVRSGAGTAVTYQLAVAVKIPMLGILKRRAEKGIIDTALKELKKRVEG